VATVPNAERMDNAIINLVTPSLEKFVKMASIKRGYVMASKTTVAIREYCIFDNLFLIKSIRDIWAKPARATHKVHVISHKRLYNSRLLLRVIFKNHVLTVEYINAPTMSIKLAYRR